MGYIFSIIVIAVLANLGFSCRFRLLSSVEKFVSLPWICKFAIDTCIGSSVFFLITHLFSLILKDFNLSLQITAGIALIYLVINFRTSLNWFVEIKESDHSLLLTIFALFLAYLLFYKNLNIGDSAKYNFSMIGSLINNNNYPPLAAFDFRQEGGYHFGIVMFSALFKSLCGLSVFEASGVQFGLQIFLTVLTLFGLFHSLTKSKAAAVVGMLCFLHYKSLVEGSLLVGMLYSRSRTLTIPLIITLLLLIYHYYDKESRRASDAWVLALAVSSLSFLVYLSYPAFYYQLIIGAFAFIFVEMVFYRKFNTETFMAGLLFVGSIGLGRILTFLGSCTTLNGIQGLVFKPSLSWYTPLIPELKDYQPQFTSIQLERIVEVPIFSWYSLKLYVIVFLLATVMYLIDLFSQKNKIASILYFAALASTIVPFLIMFEPYPRDIERFLCFTQIASILYILIFILSRLQNIFPQNIGFVSFALLVASAYSFHYVVIQNPKIFHTYAVPLEQIEFVQELEQIHKPGDVIVDTEFLHLHSTYPNIAGFYGTGGHFYAADLASRQTAIFLLNPILLQELGADYVLINQKSKYARSISKTIRITQANELSRQALTRMQDQNLFERIDLESSPDSILLKFKAKDKNFSDEEVKNYRSEYRWFVGKRNKYAFTPLRVQGGANLSAASRDELEKIFEQIKNEIAKSNIELAVSIGMSAMALR